MCHTHTPAHTHTHTLDDDAQQLTAAGRVQMQAGAAVRVGGGVRQAGGGAGQQRVVKVADVADEASLPLKYRVARRVGRMLGWFSAESSAIRASKPLLASFSELAEDADVAGSIGLAPAAFSTWYSLVVLQTWMYMVRLRTEGAYGAQMRQALFDSLWEEVELKIRDKGITQDSLLARNVKDLLAHFYGAAVGYDEGFIGDDAAMAAALWRNLFAMSTDVEADELARMVAYVRAQLVDLQAADSADILAGEYVFPPPPPPFTSL